MINTIKTAIAILGMLVLLGIAIKVWVLYQQDYVCEPKARQAIANFIRLTAGGSYESLSDRSMFVDKKQFGDFKSNISFEHSTEIKEWLSPTDASVIVQFSSGASYALVVVTNPALLPNCWKTEYSVLTVR